MLLPFCQWFGIPTIYVNNISLTSYEKVAVQPKAVKQKPASSDSSSESESEDDKVTCCEFFFLYNF